MAQVAKLQALDEEHVRSRSAALLREGAAKAVVEKALAELRLSHEESVETAQQAYTTLQAEHALELTAIADSTEAQVRPRFGRA